MIIHKRSVIWTKFNDDEFSQLVSRCNSYREMHTCIGTISKGDNNITLKKRISELNLDTSHFNKCCNNMVNVNKNKVPPLDAVLVANCTYNRHSLKRRLIKEKLIENKCSICKQLPIWNGISLSLQLDHINGVSDDNTLDNLRLLCPNCHSQTSTFAGKSNKKTRTKENKIIKQTGICLCGNIKSKYSIKCIECQHIKRRTHDRPSVDELINSIKQTSYVSVSNKYGVSDNAIRKWVKNYGFNPKTFEPID